MNELGFMLIVAISSHSGNYLGKLTIGPFDSKTECESIVLDKKRNLKYDRVCVSMDHYASRKIDKNIYAD